MIFGKDKNTINEKVIHELKPNFFFQCKKGIFAFFVLAYLLGSTSTIIKMIADLQIYIIERVKLPLTSYTVIAIVVVVLILIFYILINILSWYSTRYMLTDQRIITEKGIVFTKKNYMPYQNIQDVSTQQSILGRIFKIASVSSFSAYDNNHIKFENISNSSEVEEIIFSKINFNRMDNQREIYPQYNYQNNQREIYPQYNYQNNQKEIYPQYDYKEEHHNLFEEEYPPYENGEYYPKDNYNREEYYPKDNFQDEFLKDNRYEENQYQSRQNFNDNEMDNTIKEAMNNLEGKTKFKQHPNDYQSERFNENQHYDERYSQNNYNQQERYPENNNPSQGNYPPQERYHQNNNPSQGNYSQQERYPQNNNPSNRNYNQQVKYPQNNNPSQGNYNQQDKYPQNNYEQENNENLNSKIKSKESILERHSKKFKK